MAKLNPDASAAVQSARKGNCRDALKHLYDAAPHMQVSCGSPGHEAAVKDFKTASVIVAGLCTVNAKSGTYRSTGFDGARRRRRRR